MNCDNCAKFQKVENVVPYGDTRVSETLWQCTNGYNNGDCPPEAFVPIEPHYAKRSYLSRFSEEQLAWGDMAGDMAREERCR